MGISANFRHVKAVEYNPDLLFSMPDCIYNFDKMLCLETVVYIYKLNMTKQHFNSITLTRSSSSSSVVHNLYQRN